MTAASNQNVKVAVRVRPFDQREINQNSKCVISMKENQTTIRNPINGETKQFTFDHSYWSHDGFYENNGSLSGNDRYADQSAVFDDLGQGVLDNAWNGYNATLFAYGQTGSGKSYSMIGTAADPGIVPITCGELFKTIGKNENNSDKKFQVTFSMLEIYNEQIKDLLSNNKSTNLKVRENSKLGFYVEGLSHHPCSDYVTIERLMTSGAINRTTAATNMNATSSRSHMVISIKFDQIFNNEFGESTTKSSEINLVDLAGSERATSTGATGDRLKEASTINTSLLTLGSVIETLASENSNTVVPYRNSVLTKLLKSALGGNSKTVMIAALSPADINYGETLSTLRYANRAKNIQNKAVINESLTDKLIRELKEENKRLLAQLSRQSSKDNLIDSGEVKRLLIQNELEMTEMTTSWEEKLEKVRKEWEAEKLKNEKSEDDRNLPYLQNVNEDSQLSGVIKHFICNGITFAGRDVKRENENRIVMQGLGILDTHFKITNTNGKIELEPCGSAEILVNGIRLEEKTDLKNGDRLKFGSNSLFLYIGDKHERNADDAKKYDYQFFQNEISSNLFDNSDTGQSLCQKDEKALKAIYLDYIYHLPIISNVNAMSNEMGRNIKFSLFLEKFSRGQDIRNELMVKAENQVTQQVWIWTINKFTNRRFMIEDLYMKYLEDPSVLVDLEISVDPFWDPVEDVYLGSAHVWLHSLAHYMQFNEEISVTNHTGKAEAKLHVSISPCLPSGKVVGDELMIIEPTENLGKQVCFMVELKRCRDINWVEECNTRGIFAKFKFYNENDGHQSKVIWNSFDLNINFKQQILVESLDQNLLDYLQFSALIVELWGTQSGRKAPEIEKQDCGIIKNIDPRTLPAPTPLNSNSTDIELLAMELEKTKNYLQIATQDNKELKNICFILKKQNNNLKQSIEHKNGFNRKNSCNDLNKFRPQSSTRVQAELGIAIKEFFGDMKPIKNKINRMPNCETVSCELEEALQSFRNSVSHAVRTHRTDRYNGS